MYCHDPRPTIYDHGLNRRTRRLICRLFKIPFKGARFDWNTTVLKVWRDTRGRLHNSHYHTFTSISSSWNFTHSHSGPTGETKSCLPPTVPYSHNHSITFTSSYPSHRHYHTKSGQTSTESATDLNHTHTITTSLTGGNHTHANTCSSNYCQSCDSADPEPHSHPTSGSVSNDAPHNHSISCTTGTGSGTLESHTHSFSTSSGGGSSHRHFIPGGGITLTAAQCYLLNSHSHWAAGTYSGWESGHSHSWSGSTDTGGEPPPGWTGKISGVTNPARIMNTLRANIAKVKGYG